MSRVIGYVRVSTAKQGDEGLSLIAQEGTIKKWAAERGNEVVAIFSDVMSGTKDSRPGLAQALAELKSGDTLVFYSLSRLSRSTKHLTELSDLAEKNGFDLVSTSEPFDTRGSLGKLMFNLLAAIAAFERDLTSERTKAVLRHKIDNGERVGRPCFGQTAKDGVLEVIECEQAIIAAVNEGCQLGQSPAEITKRLEVEGHTTKTGMPPSIDQVRRLVKKTLATNPVPIIEQPDPMPEVVSVPVLEIEIATPILFGEAVTLPTPIISDDQQIIALPEFIGPPKPKAVRQVPFGYARHEGEITDDFREQKVIIAIMKYRVKGMSFRKIVEQIKIDGYVSRSGKPLSLTQVTRIVYKHLN